MTSRLNTKATVKATLLSLLIVALVALPSLFLVKTFATPRASGLLAYVSTEDMKVRAQLVVYGKLAEGTKPRSFVINPTSGGMGMGALDYSFQPEAILRGEHGDGPVTVRVFSMLDTEAQLEKGKEYILFLFNPGGGGGYNTEGDDWYYVVGAEQGCFEGGRDGVFYSKSGEKMELTPLAKELEVINVESPVDKDFYIKENINNVTENYKTGFISEAEYKRSMEQMNIYAAESK